MRAVNCVDGVYVHAVRTEQRGLKIVWWYVCVDIIVRVCVCTKQCVSIGVCTCVG